MLWGWPFFCVRGALFSSHWRDDGPKYASWPSFLYLPMNVTPALVLGVRVRGACPLKSSLYQGFGVFVLQGDILVIPVDNDVVGPKTSVIFMI